MCAWKERDRVYLCMQMQMAHFHSLDVTAVDSVMFLLSCSNACTVWASDRKLTGFAPQAPSQSFMRWWWCDFKRRSSDWDNNLQAAPAGTMVGTNTSRGRVDGIGDREGRGRREIGNLSGIEEKQNNSTEWGTGLPGRWQKDISPLWQGQTPLSMRRTLQGQEKQTGGEALSSKDFVFHQWKSTKDSAMPQWYWFTADL